MGVFKFVNLRMCSVINAIEFLILNSFLLSFFSCFIFRFNKYLLKCLLWTKNMLEPMQAHSHLRKLSVLKFFLKHLLHIIKIRGVLGTTIPMSYTFCASPLFLNLGKFLSHILIVPHTDTQI